MSASKTERAQAVDTDLCWRIACQHPRVCHGRAVSGGCDGLTLSWPDDRCPCDTFLEEDDA